MEDGGVIRKSIRERMTLRQAYQMEERVRILARVRQTERRLNEQVRGGLEKVRSE